MISPLAMNDYSALFAGQYNSVYYQDILIQYIFVFKVFNCLLFVHILCFEIYYNFVCIVLLFVMGY